ncbi:hypothetical protein [Trichloromonas acetexigens]|jgi:hypothetical protein|uniref:DAHP synthase ferredoxin-like domain-containing protein n=1 Tax=Trichloromonas acetexigens TaxID=38815 RepID=A0A550JHY5_9BACT|nr:hypothetical protein [Desulfuromonas acetexigens]TRO82808.1 hypothetical protein FL622_05190 [Desulfuromonas acetexigens]
MLIVMKKNVTENELQQVKEYLIERDFDFHQSTGANRVILGVIGDTGRVSVDDLQAQPGVQQVFKISEEE